MAPMTGRGSAGWASIRQQTTGKAALASQPSQRGQAPKADIATTTQQRAVAAKPHAAPRWPRWYPPTAAMTPPATPKTTQPGRQNSTQTRRTPPTSHAIAAFALTLLS